MQCVCIWKKLPNAQPDRPAEAGMMVPVVVRDAEHLHSSLFP